MVTDTEAYAADVIEETSAYLRAVEASVAPLAEAVAAYGGPDFPAVCDRIVERESAADDHLRSLRTLLGRLAPPNYTDVYLQTGAVMRLYALVDEVPDAAERFVRDLGTLGPVFSDAARTQLRDLATLLVEVVETLTAMVERLVADLVADGESETLTGDVQYLAGLESDCDGHRRRAVEAAFETCETADALVVRDVARSLDGVADAAEAAADHLLFMQGTRS
jgi:uncharacterized protein Yka (UPF0111/DUF47 family)